MKIALLIFAPLAVGVIADTTYGQSLHLIGGYHRFALLSPYISAVSDAKKIIKYTDPTSGSAASAFLFSGHVIFRPSNSTSLWSTNLLVVTNNNTVYAKSIRMSGSIPTSADGDGAAAAVATDFPGCQTGQCNFTVSNGNLFVNGIQVPGDKYTGGIPDNPDAVATVDGNNVKITLLRELVESPQIMTSTTDPIMAGGGAGRGEGGCDAVVSAAAELLHVQPQEVQVQPEVPSKGVQPADETDPCD